ncbi:MAG: hypothetical protein ACFFD6_04640 [Candidatus Thorarchaeota archaeon]
MNDKEIVDYSRQSTVNRAYVVILLAFIVFGAYSRYVNAVDFELLLWLYIALPIALLFISIVLGALSKRAIDYTPGEWEKRKVWVSFSDYERMAENYDDAYGHLSGNPGGCAWALCLLPVAAVLGVLSIFYLSLATPLFNPLFDSLLLLVILYSTVSVTGFVNGFRIPSIDAEEFFKPPVKGDVYDFASELEAVPGYRAGLNVELGVRSGVQTIIGADIKTYLDNLPDTVSVSVQVSHSGFAYPYLVGTIYKGARVSEEKDSYRISTKYPAIIETSMDDDVSVFVARFDIPKRTSGVPHISNRDFRRLALLLAEKLTEHYNQSK